MDKSRQQFEAWFNNGYAYSKLIKAIENVLWDVWQASRESLESQIKPHQFSQLVNDTKDAAIKYKDCQCLRDALSRVMRDSLISSGVKIKND